MVEHFSALYSNSVTGNRIASMSCLFVKSVGDSEKKRMGIDQELLWLSWLKDLFICILTALSFFRIWDKIDISFHEENKTIALFQMWFLHKVTVHDFYCIMLYNLFIFTCTFYSWSLSKINYCFWNRLYCFSSIGRKCNKILPF